MAPVRRSWRQLVAGASGDQSPVIGIAIVVLATAVVLLVGWGLAALASLVY